MVKKLYLYKLISDQPDNSILKSRSDDGIFIAENGTLLGLDRHIWRGEKIKSIESKYLIKPFEVRQKNFDLLISNAVELNISLVQIKFSDELEESEHEFLKKIIWENDTNDLLAFIDEQRYDFGRDIEEITFRFTHIPVNHIISFSRSGVLTTNIDEDNPLEVLSTNPIGLLAGTYLPNLNDESERYH